MTTGNTILVDSTHKKQMWVVMCYLALALTQEQSHKTFGEKMDVDLDWDDAFKDAISPILRLHLMQTLKTGFNLKNPFALGN